MRRVRFAFIALLLGGIVAGCSTGHIPNPATSGGRPSATTTPVRDRGAGEVPDNTTSHGIANHGRPSSSEAVATATAYVRREVGMRDPVAGPFRWSGPSTGQVEIHPRVGEGGQVVTSPITVVSLQRLSSIWYVLGTRTSNIAVTQPGPLTKIGSPVRVAGRALAFEGNVQVRVTEDRYGKDILLGSGSVTGGGDALRPFAGQIAFRYPTGGTGSILFAERSAANGDVLAATVIRVRFAPAPRFPGIWETTTWKAAYELQDAVDNGHQPWRLGAINVVTLYAEVVLLPGPERPVVRQTGPTTFTVTRPGGTLIATVQVAQPVKQSGGIWVITGVDPTP